MTRLGRSLLLCLAVAAPRVALGHGSAADRAARLDHEVELAPRDPAALVARAELALETGSPRLAIADLERARELDAAGSDEGRLRRELLLAQAHLTAGDPDAAGVVLARILADTPEEPRALYLRSRIAAADERYEPAAADLERAIAGTSDPAASAYLELCELHVASGDDDRALGVLTAAAERFGPLAVIIDAAIAIERRRERFPEALAWNDRSEERLRLSPAGRARRAELLAGLGRWPEAEAEAELGLRALERLPDARKASAAMVATEAQLQATVAAARAQPAPPAPTESEANGPLVSLVVGAGLALLLAAARRRAVLRRV